ncbi:transposase [Pedobacter africanus]|uniref:Transposase n=1 Tax=Pedobacter africanus TaxID=151894 RepID=A0ACC6KTK8_9SPHI|nr:IS66 family transposase [Pedobacter africanus]MDR6782698.1 transposase [Pedobacter africanus]
MGYKANINCSELLEAALQENQALRLENAMLQQQVTDLSDTVDSQDHIIRQQAVEILDKDHQIADQELTISSLEQRCHNLSELCDLQQKLINELRTQTEGDQKQVAKLVKDLDKIKHSKALLVKDKYGHKSEKTRDTTFDASLKGIGLTPEELAEANAFFAEHGHVKIEKKPTTDILKQGLPVKTITVAGPKGSIYKGETTVYKLVHHKAWMEVHKIVRHVWLPEGSDIAITAPIPGSPAKCKADASMIAQLLLDKFLYHMPLQRQQQKYQRSGVNIAYSTLNDWISYGCKALTPLWEVLMVEAVKNQYLHCDETGFKVIDKAKEGKDKLHRGQMWVLVNPAQGLAVFKYAKGRGHKDIDGILGNFKGILHTDGYGAYDKYGLQLDVQHGKCMTHCRRYFLQAEGHKGSRKKARYVIRTFFDPIYAIERQCREMEYQWEEITEIRQKHAVPILQAFHKWLLENQHTVKLETPIATAINYILKRWEGIMLYTTEGMLQIDNNCAERMIKDMAVGRKNWLFAGSHEAAAEAAVMFSLMGTCKLQGIDPEAWLTDVLLRVATCPKAELINLLPHKWKHKQAAA